VTHSGLKRRMGLGKLRVRGEKSVFNVVLLKVTGWNIFRAAAAKVRKAKRAIQAETIASTGALMSLFALFGPVAIGQGSRPWLRPTWRI